MKVNGIEIKGIGFAFDGCHKIYVVKNKQQAKQAQESGYITYQMHHLPHIWSNACPLRFISTWDLTDYYVHQSEQAVFTD